MADPARVTFLVNELDWDYENRGGVKEGEIISFQLVMAPVALSLNPTVVKKLDLVSEAGMYETAGIVTSAASIGPMRVAMVDCGVPVRVGFPPELMVPRPQRKVAALGVLEGLISFDASPIFSPVVGQVMRTSTIGEEIRMHLVTVSIVDGSLAPEFEFDWRPTLFSRAVPRSAHLQTRIRGQRRLFHAEVADSEKEDSWMISAQMDLQALCDFLKRMGWKTDEIVRALDDSSPDWRREYPGLDLRRDASLAH